EATALIVNPRWSQCTYGISLRRNEETMDAEMRNAAVPPIKIIAVSQRLFASETPRYSRKPWTVPPEIAAIVLHVNARIHRAIARWELLRRNVTTPKVIPAIASR